MSSVVLLLVTQGRPLQAVPPAPVPLAAPVICMAFGPLVQTFGAAQFNHASGAGALVSMYPGRWMPLLP